MPAREDPFAVLAELYAPGAQAVVRAGRTYPCAVEPARDGAALDTFLQLGAGEASIDPELERLGEAHLQQLLAGGAKLTDGAVVAMDAAGPHGVAASHASYFQMLRSCDALRAEWDAAPSQDRAELERLPLRALAHVAAGADPVRSGRGRAAAIGLTLLLVMRGEVLIGRRRPALAMDGGKWHIAPSGMLEPRAGTDALRASLSAELREELPGLASAELDRCVPIGIGYDLLRLRPDICAIAEVGADVADRWDWSLSSQEFVEAKGVTLTPQGLEAFWAQHGPDDVTAAAAAALALLEERWCKPRSGEGIEPSKRGVAAPCRF